MQRRNQGAYGVRWMHGVLGIGIVVGCVGCGDTRTSRPDDAGQSDDAGSASDDGGPPVGGGNTATWSVGGAQSEFRAHDDEVNYVSCILTPDGLLDMTSSEYAGGDPSITVRIRGYSGPRTYELVYDSGGDDGSADLRLLGGYTYWYFYDYSTVDFSEIPSTCSIDVTEVVPGARIHATIACSDLVAQITSPDYDNRDAAGFRPHASLSATFDCDL